MNDTTQTLLRSVLKLAAGAAVAQGYTDNNTAEIIIAGLFALAGVAWGVLHRTAAAAPEAVKIKVSLFALAAALAFAPGCASTPSRIAYNSVSVPVATVDQAMLAWGSYVAQFHPPAADELKVKDAFEEYRAAALLAVDAAQAFAEASTSTNNVTAVDTLNFARDKAAGALADLVALVNALTQETP